MSCKQFVEVLDRLLMLACVDLPYAQRCMLYASCCLLALNCLATGSLPPQCQDAVLLLEPTVGWRIAAPEGSRTRSARQPSPSPRRARSTPCVPRVPLRRLPHLPPLRSQKRLRTARSIAWAVRSASGGIEPRERCGRAGRYVTPLAESLSPSDCDCDCALGGAGAEAAKARAQRLIRHYTPRV